MIRLSLKAFAAVTLSTFIVGLGMISLKNKATHDGVTFELTPSGDSMIFSANDANGRNLYSLNLITRQVKQITHVRGWVTDPAISPDGKFLAYSESVDEEKSRYLCVYDFEKQVSRRLDETRAYDETPAFNQDGKLVYFGRAKRRRPYSMGGFVWDERDLCVVPFAGGKVTTLTEEKFSKVFSLSRRQQTLYLSAEKYDQHEFRTFHYKPSTKELTKLTALGKAVMTVPSPEGEVLIGIADVRVPFNYDVVEYNLKSGEKRSLTTNEAYNWAPKMSPDGKQIYFLSDQDREDRFELWRMNRDGSGLERIADSSLFDDPLKWKPEKGAK